MKRQKQDIVDIKVREEGEARKRNVIYADRHADNMEERPPLFGYLYASPLTQQAGDGQLVESVEELVSVRSEAEEFRAMFEAQGRAVRLQTSVASRRGLRQILSAAPDVVHFTGHGFPDGFLALEDGTGNLDKLSTCDLQHMLVNNSNGEKGGLNPLSPSSNGIKLVFISACFSEDTGEVFARAGVPHVVAVRRDVAVADKVSSEFAKAFYQALLSGFTVLEAFLHARKCIQLTPGRNDAWRARQMTKFLLLPRDDVDHEVCVLANGHGGVKPGIFVDESVPPPINSCGKVTHHFVGRQVLVQKTIRFLVGTDDDDDAMHIAEEKKNARFPWVTLYGQQGIGKSSCAVSACDFLTQRGNAKGVFYLPMSRKEKVNGGDSQQHHQGQMRSDLLNLIRAHAPVGTGLSAVQSERELWHALSALSAASPCRGPIVIFFDGCDHWVGSSSSAREVLCDFIRDLLDGACGAVAVLCTSQFPLRPLLQRGDSARSFGGNLASTQGLDTGEKLIEECAMKVGPLSSLHSAQLLIKMSRRQLSESEVMFGSSSGMFQHLSKDQQLAQLAKHPAMVACAGHPLIIGQITERLATESLNNLLEQAKAAAKSLAAAAAATSSDNFSAPCSNGSRFSLPRSSALGSQAPLPPTNLLASKGDSGRDFSSFASFPKSAESPSIPALGSQRNEQQSLCPVWDKSRLEALCAVASAVPRGNPGDLWRAVRQNVSQLVDVAFNKAPQISRPFPPESIERLSIVLQLQGGGNAAVEHRAALAKLWRWLQATLNTLLAFSEYWNRSIIYGLISKGDVGIRLRDRPCGTFLVRISESQAGQLALGVKESEPGQVRHVLVAPAKDVGSCAVQVQTHKGLKKYATFADFIRTWPSLILLYPEIEKHGALPQ